MKRILVIFIALLLTAGSVFSQKKETYRVRTLVVDPGHGGAKPGAQGSRSWEKDITLAVAKKFGKLVEDNYPDVKVIYTRTNDADISLAERAHIANRNKADLFISIHANSHPTSAPTGVETFVMGLSESKANLEVAKKENADILLEADYQNNKDYSGFDPNSPESYVMLAMFQNSFLDKSLNLAQAIQTQYRKNLKTINRGVKQAELYVLYKTTCPSVLTEIGFISNPTEEAFMLSTEGQAKIAVCLFDAFVNYKATEEGSDKPANLKYNIEGYNAKPAAKPAPEPEPVPAPEPVAATVTDSAAAVTPAAPEPAATAPAKSEVAVANVPVSAAPTAKPTPVATLPAAPKVEARPEPKEETTLVPTPVPALRAPANTAAANASQYYTVQFLVAPVLYSAGASQLGGITDFSAAHKAQSYVYTTGRFRTFKEASDYCEHLRAATPFKDAWVFLCKEPATTTEAEAPKPARTEVATTKPATTEAKPAAQGKLTYRVQFCTATRRMKAGDPDLKGIKDFHIAPSGKVFVYTAGDYATLAEAKTRCRQIQQSTSFKDAFVVAIYNGQRIDLDRAAQIEKKSK